VLEGARKEPRVDVNWLSRWTPRGFLGGRNKNVSLGGAFVCCRKPLPVGEVFRLTMIAPDGEPITASAEVVWSNASLPTQSDKSRMASTSQEHQINTSAGYVRCSKNTAEHFAAIILQCSGLAHQGECRPVRHRAYENEWGRTGSLKNAMHLRRKRQRIRYFSTARFRYARWNDIEVDRNAIV